MSPFNQFVVASETINVHTASQQCADSWWIKHAAPTSDKSAFYAEVRRRDAEFWSRQPREVPVFTDQRFGPIKPTRAGVPALDAI